MRRIVYAICLAGLAFVVSRGATALGMPTWIGISAAAGFFLMAIFTAAFSSFSSPLPRGMPAGDPLLDRTALDAMERLYASGRPLTSRQISTAPDHHAVVRRLHEARILMPVPRPQGEEICWTLTPYGRALQSRRTSYTPLRT